MRKRSEMLLTRIFAPLRLCAKSPPAPSRRRSKRALLRTLLAAAALSLIQQGLRAQEAGRITDRVAAVVEGEIITLSDLQWLVRYRNMAVPSQAQPRQEFYRQLLDKLVDEKLIAREAVRTPGIQVSEADVDLRLEQYRGQFATQADYQARLDEMQMSPDDLRLLTRQQLTVFRYLKLRIEPFIIVLPDEIEAYYRQSLVRELEANNQPVPALELVEEEVRQILSVQKTTRELDLWVAEQRRKSDVHILLFREPPFAPNLPRELQSKTRSRPADGDR